MTKLSQPSVNVLLVEDDNFLAQIYKKRFELAGYKVTLAENGEVGLVEVKKKRPDIILLDILMPLMDGFEVLAQLKENIEWATIPVVMLTNLGQKEDVEKGFALGAEDYLIKAHFKPSEMVTKVQAILAKHA